MNVTKVVPRYLLPFLIVAEPTADIKARLPDAETEFSPCAELMHCAACSTVLSQWHKTSNTWLTKLAIRQRPAGGNSDIGEPSRYSVVDDRKKPMGGGRVVVGLSPRQMVIVRRKYAIMESTGGEIAGITPCNERSQDRRRAETPLLVDEHL
jgi:hypothetical protein